MPTGNEIQEFAEAVGAFEPTPDYEGYWQWRALFKRRNYFILQGCFMIVKISRTGRPFWGVDKKYIDLLNKLDNFYLVLLVSAGEGWVFSKSQVNMHIASKRWEVAKDNNYKINPPLPDVNWFIGVEQFFMRAAFPSESRNVP
ncbi:MAG: hypothetical protein IT365_04285 [Candidatus Hydrogenedentes bacterium]|nr:hypothetical protein [Candidatus Hydrogenedentota bacterium]